MLHVDTFQRNEESYFFVSFTMYVQFDFWKMKMNTKNCSAFKR